MPLTGQQITRLAEELDQHWDQATLVLFAESLNVNLPNLAPSGSLKTKAQKFVTHMNSMLPPRDRELLEGLSFRGNAALRAVANELLVPSYYSPTGDPHDAIVLGRRAFIDRAELRAVLREFTTPTPYTTHVLIIRGEEPGGKSYSWEFIRHLAANTVGAVTHRLWLKNTGYAPRDIFAQVGTLLLLDLSRLPSLTDNPQLARIDPLVNWFKGQVMTLASPFWLIIDDLSDPSVTPAMRQTAYALARSVEELKPPHFWITLVGYNEPVTDTELRYIARDEAKFPDASLIAEHFEWMAKQSPSPLTQERAREIADLLLSKFTPLDKESMSRLTELTERMGEKLKLGQQP